MRQDVEEDPADICLRCGRCCYAKVAIGADLYCTDIPCRFLDAATNLCTVYQHRFAANPECLTIDDGIRMGVFPADCPYVAGVAGYRPPRADCDKKEMGRLYLELP